MTKTKDTNKNENNQKEKNNRKWEQEIDVAEYE